MSDLIIGIHSIAAAIKNVNREHFVLWCTKESLDELKKVGQIDLVDLEKIDLKIVSVHKVQEAAKKIFLEHKFHYSRVSSNLLLEVNSLPMTDVSWILNKIECGKALKILCLDQVTDAHNGAAILRTAAFYGIDCLVTAVKGNFGSSPTFFRISSGACEYVRIIRCASLPKLINKFQQLGLQCIALSEHAHDNKLDVDRSKSVCLILGAEDVGLSHALERVVEKKIALIPVGSIKSLNVSVAGAVAMEKLFGIG